MDLIDLQIKSLKSQLNFLKNDYNYKQTLIEKGDKEFQKMMKGILSENPELEELYSQKEEERKNKIIQNIINETKIEEGNSELSNEAENNDDNDDNDNKLDTPISTKEVDPKIKKLYRQIVKLTHPDKVNNEKLNKLYLTATNFYESLNYPGIYEICDELNIKYKLEKSELQSFSQEIENLKGKIQFIQGTYTWKWEQATSKKEKKQIVIDFINMKLNN